MLKLMNIREEKREEERTKRNQLANGSTHWPEPVKPGFLNWFLFVLSSSLFSSRMFIKGDVSERMDCSLRIHTGLRAAADSSDVSVNGASSLLTAWKALTSRRQCCCGVIHCLSGVLRHCTRDTRAYSSHSLHLSRWIRRSPNNNGLKHLL